MSLDYRPAMSMFGRSNGSKDEVNRKVENCAFEAQPQVIVEQGAGVQHASARVPVGAFESVRGKQLLFNFSGSMALLVK